MLKVGDYITTYSSGYFRIEKIVDRYAQETKDGYVKGEKIESIVFSKQVFNQTFDFTLGFDRSNEEDCKKVSKKIVAIIDEYFSTHQEDFQELLKYEIPDIKKNKNIMLTLSDEEFEKMKVMLFNMKHKFSLNELKHEFIKNKFENCIGNKGPNTYMLQIVNINYSTNSKKEELYLFDKIKKLGR